METHGPADDFVFLFIWDIGLKSCNFNTIIACWLAKWIVNNNLHTVEGVLFWISPMCYPDVCWLHKKNPTIMALSQDLISARRCQNRIQDLLE